MNKIEAIFSKAIQSDDAHVLKFVYTCCEEHRVYGIPYYRSLAWGKVLKGKL